MNPPLFRHKEAMPMDEIVRQAMLKWPNVPYCYRWLALDARGAWRMRDEHAQARGLAGQRIANAALNGFINRNYTHDARGAWYFQNGPQRVYVDLEVTPYVAHTDPAQGFVLHTGEPVTLIDEIWMTEDGRLVLQSQDRIAAIDDRDMSECLAALKLNGEPITEDALSQWLDGKGDNELIYHHASRDIPVQHVCEGDLESRFGFVRRPASEDRTP
jgi:hypothetical protein